MLNKFPSYNVLLIVVVLKLSRGQRVRKITSDTTFVPSNSVSWDTWIFDPASQVASRSVIVVRLPDSAPDIRVTDIFTGLNLTCHIAV